MTAHRAAWLEGIGDIAPGLEVCHRCDNPPCTELLHLFLGTSQDNADDMVAKDRSTRGERNNTAKLTDGQALEILRAYRDGGVSQRQLAIRYGVTRGNIQFLLKRRTWKHLHWPERID
jgi:hypothetical protein